MNLHRLAEPKKGVRLIPRYSFRLWRVTVKLRAFLPTILCRTHCWKTLRVGNVCGHLETAPCCAEGSPHVERARPARMAEDVDPHRLGSHSKRPGKASGAASLMHRAAARASFGGGTTTWGPPCCGGCCGGAAGAARAASAVGAAGGATPAGCSECRACPTPHPKCCPISRSEVDSLHPDRPTAAERATVARPSPGRRSFLFCGRWLADYCSRSSP